MVGGGGVAAAETAQRRLETTKSGHAVGSQRPSTLRSTTLTYRVPTDSPWVALTFDDGPSPRYTGRILDILDEKNVVATFNVIGEHALAWPELTRRTAQRHEIGNHTYSHRDLSLAGAAEARDELTRGAAAIKYVTGREPTTFRPPYGYFSGATMMIAAGFDYPVVLWDQIIRRTGESASSNAQRIAGSVGPGSIILGHDGGSKPCEVVVDTLPELIDRIHARGFTFVTTTALLAARQVGVNGSANPPGIN
ncbi:MAG: Chitooligosaccharide deacetylase [Pseudonocardiales bacterium]|nr:Chitooligosaccharide deacetylase [Pseudonocardiales bacterium]